MKILMFSKVPIAPAFGGNRQRILTLVAELQRSHTVHFALIPSRQMADFDRISHCSTLGFDNFHVVHRNKIFEKIFYLRLARMKALAKVRGKARSNNIDYVFDRSLIASCRDIISVTRPDVIIVEYVHFSKILELSPAGTMGIIDTHDSFSEEFTPSAEAEGLKRANLVLAIQSKEAESFRALLGELQGPTRVKVVSHIVDPSEQVDLTFCAGATFLGSQFEANDASLRALISNVMPLVLAQRPNFKLHVIGSVGEAIGSLPFVVKHGRVSDLGSTISLAPVLANYITRGTGIKIKLLDAMSMGVPCVSTRLGAEGLTGEALSGVTIAEDDQQFSDRLISLFDSQARRNTLGQAGFQYILHWNEAQRRSLRDAIASLGSSSDFATAA